jgi:hypothetical protein
MIATRLHAKRHSTSTLHRPSITIIRNQSYRQHHRRASKRFSNDIQDIDSAINENINEVHEDAQVEIIYLNKCV